jgi:glycerophosphoryl diester phosphodiesterase
MMRALAKGAACAAILSSALACKPTAAAPADPVSALTVEPVALSLTPDDSASLTAKASSASGSPLATRISWISSDPTIVDVTPAGEVRAMRQGSAQVTAVAGRKTATATVSATYAALRGVRLYAHRGFGTVFPENTLVAADSALARGADGVETDVQLTADGVAVIIHDGTVDRTTNGSGTVASMTVAEIRALDACSKKGDQWAPCQIPLASGMIDKVKGRGLLILDLKGAWPTSQLQKLMGMVRERGMIDSTMVTSFELQHLTRVRQVAPRVTLGWLKSNPDDPAPALALGKVAILVDEQSIRRNASNMASYDSLLTAQKSLLGAFTIYSANVVPTLKSLGVGWYISDIPLDKSALSTP